MEQDLKLLQKQEVIKRLKILHDNFQLMGTVVKEFEQKGTVYYSEYINQYQQGVLYFVSNKISLTNHIKDFEEKQYFIRDV